MVTQMGNLHAAYRDAYITINKKLDDDAYRRYYGNYELALDFLDEAFWCSKKAEAVRKIVIAYNYIPRGDEETRRALINLIIEVAEGDTYE